MQPSTRNWTVIFTASILAVCWLGVAGASSTSENPAGLRISASAEFQPRVAARTLTCKIVSTSLIGRDLGTSVVLSASGVNGAPNPSPFILFGKTLRVGGKVFLESHLDCNYMHNPKDLSSMGVALSYYIEATPAKALAVVKAMCAIISATGPSNYSTPRIGNGACVQGHSGYMQSANGVAAIRNVMVYAFGGQSPAQTIALLQSIAQAFAAAPITTTSMMNSQPVKGTKPIVTIKSTQFNVNNGFMALALSCKGSRCQGVVQLTEPTNAGPVILATAKYVFLPGSSKTLNMSLTAQGVTYFSSASSFPVQLQLSVTVAGGKSLSLTVAVNYFSTTPSSGVTTTTAQVTTSIPG